MAAASNSSTSPVHAQNSPRSRQSRRSSAARTNLLPSDNSPPPFSLSEGVDQEHFVTSSSATPSFESHSKEAHTAMAESIDLGEDGSTAPTGADCAVDNNENGAAAKKAWNKPSNRPTAEVGAVMGAESWPALSESARGSPKSSSTYPVKTSSHGSISAPQEVPVVSVSSPKKVNTNISTPVSSSSNAPPARQKSMKQRGGGGSGLSHNTVAANGSLSEASPTAGAVVEAPPSNPGKSGGSVGESSRDNIQRDAGPKGGSHGGNEQQQQHPRSFRRSGTFPRGDGSYHHSNGGRQERGKQDWGNSHRNFGSRDIQSSHQRGVGSRPFLRGPAPNAPFIPPTSVVLPFPPMVYTDMPTPVYYVPAPLPESVRPMPMVPISPVYLPIHDPNLASKILNQIDYYFSNENLVKDTYLRQNMDSEGWVSISLIASFKKVSQLTDNIQIILDAIQVSNVVEVQGDKVRRKNDWIKWIMPNVQSPQPIAESNQNVLAAHINNITLEE